MKNILVGKEIDRLANLVDYKIVDTDFDSRFDNLVAMAAAHFRVPIALITLVDADRQWFKAMTGLDVRQIPRNHSFCAHAIMQPGEVMVVEDARTDPRFCDNPLVNTWPCFRFYAGAPIVTDSGAALGTVCVIDRVPRTFTAADKAMLARFAASALSLLELHRQLALQRDGASLDPLTGLPNRHGLETALDRAISPTLSGEGCGLLYVDLDHFKVVNDNFGHAIGDRLLEEMARRLLGAVRNGDLVSRFGGDEFVVLLAHPVDATAMELVAQRLLGTARTPVAIHGHAINVGVTIGGALAPRDAITQGDLVQAAYGAMRSAKRAGRGRLGLVGNDNPQPPQPNSARPEIALAEAIDRDELFLEWQSCQDIVTGEVAGYEALVRWRHPELGILAPDRFVPLAEACGLSARLDAWVLFRACAEAAACTGAYYFSVNMSAQWIANRNVVSLTRAALEQSGLDPARLVLEITETTAIGDEACALAHIGALRAMGVRVALDDFGTGYSALVCLQTYPFDMLKLDRKFVAAVGADARGRLVAEGVVKLAGLLGTEVIAEGIETPAQAKALHDIGCRRGQGFLWARARPAPWLEPASPTTLANSGAGQ